MMLKGSITWRYKVITWHYMLEQGMLHGRGNMSHDMRRVRIATVHTTERMLSSRLLEQ